MSRTHTHYEVHIKSPYSKYWEYYGEFDNVRHAIGCKKRCEEQDVDNNIKGYKYRVMKVENVTTTTKVVIKG